MMGGLGGTTGTFVPVSYSIVRRQVLIASICISKISQPSITGAGTHSGKNNVTVSIIFPRYNLCFTVPAIIKGLLLASQICFMITTVFLFYLYPSGSQSRCTKQDPATESSISVNHFLRVWFDQRFYYRFNHVLLVRIMSRGYSIWLFSKLGCDSDSFVLYCTGLNLVCNFKMIPFSGKLSSLLP